jgi:hypothetical protein
MTIRRAGSENSAPPCRKAPLRCPEDSLKIHAMSSPGFVMKPTKSILDRSFIYVPSTATSVDQTWRRFGWRPSTENGTAQELHPRPAQSAEPAPARQ